MKANFQVHLDKKKEQNQPQQQKKPQTIQRDKLRQQINGWNFFYKRELNRLSQRPIRDHLPNSRPLSNFLFL